MIDPPALDSQQRRDPPVAVPAVFFGKPDDRRRQRLFIVPALWNAPLRFPVLPQRETGPPLRYGQLLADVNDRLPPPRGA
jgi:hypothetical protein